MLVWHAGAALSNQLLISIIDDDQPFRESMEGLMRSFGYCAAVFQSAADFLASPRLGKTSCLIADVHMPVMSGVELYRHLTEAGYAIPTILITGYPSEADRVRALKRGVLCYLRKPIDQQALSRCLHEALRLPNSDS